MAVEERLLRMRWETAVSVGEMMLAADEAFVDE